LHNEISAASAAFSAEADFLKNIKKVLDGGRGICYDSKYLEKGLFFCAQKRGHDPLREAKTIRFTGGAEE